MSARNGALLGRTFLHPAFDYLLIGGGLSLLWTLGLALAPGEGLQMGFGTLAVTLLVANSAHFAASTVRLYTKPGAVQQLPFLTMVFPLLAIAVVTGCLLAGPKAGANFYALYLTWSPYHFAAQAYGLAVMYSYRSGCQLPEREKRWLRWTCLLPFFYAFLFGMGAGLDWLVPHDVLMRPAVLEARTSLRTALDVLVFAAPLALYVHAWRRFDTPMPLISLLIMLSNGIWWVLLTWMQAFVWATVFHGIQYMLIVIIFHVKEQTAQPGNRHGGLYHAGWFYGACLLLAYGLFHALPEAYTWAGFTHVESLLVVTAAINIHHFVVDAYIWRLGRGGSNRRIVDDAVRAAA